MEGEDAEWQPTRRGVLAAAPALLAGACVRGGDPAALSFWATGYEGDYSPHLAASFTADTGIPVETQSVPGTAAHEKYLTAQAGGSLPDVLMLPAGWVGEFAMVGAIAPVPSASYLGDTVPGLSAPLRFRGVEHAVPWLAGPQVQFFRRDLLADIGYATPPGDWDGWRTMARKLKRRRPDGYAALMFLNWWDTLFTFANQAGAYPLRERDSRGNFRTPEFRAALSFYASIFADGLAPAVASSEVQDPTAAFAQGYFALYPSGPTLLTDLHRRTAEIAPAQWGTARMPGPNGPGPAGGTNNTLAVSAASRRPREAWALVRHFTSAASELRFQSMIGVLPARESAWRDPQLADPVVQTFADQMRHPAPAPAVVEWERIRIEVQLVAERVVRGLVSVDAALAEMDARADRLLAKRRELVQAGRIA